MEDKQNTPLKAIPAISVYRQNGCTLAAFKQALQYGLSNKEKELAKTFKRQVFQAAGTDLFRIRIHNQAELFAILNLALALVDKNDNPENWLSILDQPDCWNAAKLTQISPLLNKAIARLASHIPKTRNPANEGAPRFPKPTSQDTSSISASEASLSAATLEGDAVLVGARFFFELVFYLEGTPSSVLAMLLNKDEKLFGFLRHIGMDETNIKAWQSSITHLPKQLSPLQAQLLLPDASGNWLSVSPMYSVAAASWLGQWRREQFFMLQDADSIEHEGSRPLFPIESAEYGGANARNVAAILMDFSGKQHHPRVLPPPCRRNTLTRLERLIHRPGNLIKPKTLYGKRLNDLSRPDSKDLNYQQTTQILNQHIENLLDEALSDIILIRSLLDSEHEEAIAFQKLYHSIAGKHPYLHFIQAEASAVELTTIAKNITHSWLGPYQEFKGGGERYNNIQAIVIEQLHTYQLTETS